MRYHRRSLSGEPPCGASGTSGATCMHEPIYVIMHLFVGDTKGKCFAVITNKAPIQKKTHLPQVLVVPSANSSKRRQRIKFLEKHCRLVCLTENPVPVRANKIVNYSFKS